MNTTEGWKIKLKFRNMLHFKYSNKSVLRIERLNALTLLKSVDNGKPFQIFITLHTKKWLPVEIVLLGLYNLYT